MQAAFHGSDTVRFPESALCELLFGNGEIAIDTGIRSDKSIDVDHVHSINSVTEGRRLNVF